jgi:signal transduction histidine kinase
MYFRLFNSILLGCLLFLSTIARSQTINFTGGSYLISKYVEIYEDSSGNKTIHDVLKSPHFIQSKEETPNMGLTRSTFWIRFSINNNSDKLALLLEIVYPLIRSCELFKIDNGVTKVQGHDEKDPFSKRLVPYQNLVLNLDIKPGETYQYYLKIKGSNQVIIPLVVRDPQNLTKYSLIGETINSFFAGIIIVMVLYNLFIYFSTKDKSYIFYVLYVLSIGLAQLALSGYAFKYFWPTFPVFNNVSTIWFSGFAGVFAMLFVKNFLQLRERWPFGVYLININIVLYSSTGLLNLAGFELLSFRAVDIAGGIGSLGLMIIGIKLSRDGYRPAKLFLTAWVIFLLGLVMMVLRNVNILPFNNFTSYTMQLGSILEVVLLSIALADKINIFKRDREISQEAALRVSKENERIIREQNVLLEGKVQERTIKLLNTNEELQNTLNQLQEAQTQLIESEKMASLGQLTAGIAHEINNPINFVSSNIKPLRRDIDDLLDILSGYEELNALESVEELKGKLTEIENLKNDLDLDYLKTELESLLKGMEEGAGRTVEIVKGLKIFSRLDDTDLNFINLNEGIDSTLVLLNYQLGDVAIVKDYGEIPAVEGYGGKLNQVFMNILSNAIYALQAKPDPSKKPTISVKTFLGEDESVLISLRDNGTGMSEETKTKIFTPFFTTKDVGEGTGLGLSIVFKIIEAHHGSIEVNTEIGVGTEFLIKLPVKR